MRMTEARQPLSSENLPGRFRRQSGALQIAACHIANWAETTLLRPEGNHRRPAPGLSSSFLRLAKISFRGRTLRRIGEVVEYGRRLEMTDPTPQNDTEFFAQRGFGMRIGFGERPALVIIDMLKAFTDPTALLGANLDAELAATVPLLEEGHARRIPVFFSSVRYDDADLKDAGIWASKQKGVTTLKAADGGWKVDERLDFRPGDSLLFKKYASCFFGTDLSSRLMAHRVDTVIITGCTTSGCVRATAVDACQNGFRPMVVREAVGDRSAAAHAQSLFDLDAKYADVVSLEETLTYLKSLGHNSGAKL
jgi:maleamate amidohydrolase